MPIFRKAISLRSMVNIMLAGSVLLCGGLGWSAGGGQVKLDTPDAAFGPLHPNDNSDMWTVEHNAAKGKFHPKTQHPVSQQELTRLVKHNKKNLRGLLPTLEARGIAFELTPDIEGGLRRAGADEAFLAELKSYTPMARAKVSVDALRGTGPSTAEADAYNQIKSETNPDKRIQEANTFALKFPKSTLLSYVYAIQAVAYREKNDPQEVVAAGEKSLLLQPDNLMALLLVSSTLPQPQMLRVISDADKAKRLNTAEDYANKALQEIDKMSKQSGETDAAYKKRKDQMASGVYASLGMMHLGRFRMAVQVPDLAELGKAEQSYKTAIEKSKGSESAVDYFRLGEICSLEGKVEEAISAYSNAKRLAPGTVIEQYADRDIKRLKEKRSQTEAPES